MNLQVNSEVGRLHSVIVHTPGLEAALVSPDIKDELLFDDIVFEPSARIEHQGMIQIFEKTLPQGGKVYEITDLILDAFNTKNCRKFFVNRLIDVLHEENMQPIRQDLLNLNPKELYEFAVFGRTANIKNFKLLPSPNILFTRDLAAVVGGHIVLSKAAKKARIRESLLMECLIEFHPLFKSVKQKTIRLAQRDSIEGGDILVASKKLVLIGMSERTSFSGVMRAGEQLLKTGVKNVLVVDIPKQRSSMHLDTIFTFSNYDECIVFPQAISQRSDNIVSLTMRRGKMITELKSNLQDALQEYLNRDITFINCGGDDPVNQLREQWTDGANVFALAPGVIVGYERNTHTFMNLERHGYEILDQHEFLQRYRNKQFRPQKGKKMAISFEGHELCRGRGGARCMTLPIMRA